MTREELKHIVRHVFHFYDVNTESCNWADMNEACREIINVLEQEPCVDAVSRSEVNMLCARYLKTATDDHVAFYEHFCDLPSVAPTREASEWQQDHAILKAHSDGANEVLDRIKEAREEFAKGWYTRPENRYEEGKKDRSLECMRILDKLIAEVEDK